MITRAAILALSLLAAVLSGRDSARAYWHLQAATAYDRGHAPLVLPARLATDPAFQVMAAQAALGYQPAPAARVGAIDAAARAALRRDPLNPAALYQLGLVAEAGKAGSGIGFFRLAEQISRREPVNEIGLERLAAAAADNAGAIARIDRAVSVVPRLAEVVFPPLIPALADSAIRQAFIVRASRPWYPDLIATAIDKGGDPALVSTMLAAAGPFHPANRLEGLHFHLLNQAITTARFDAVRDIVAAMPPADHAAIMAIGFSPATADARLRPLGWTLINDGPVSAHITGGDSLTVTIAPEHHALAAERWTMLAPGSYQVSSTLIYDPRSPRAGVEWEVLCASPGQPSLVRLPMHTSGAARQAERWLLPVPAGCGAQIWRIKAFGDTGPGPSVASIGNLAVVRQ